MALFKHMVMVVVHQDCFHLYHPSKTNVKEALIMKGKKHCKKLFQSLSITIFEISYLFSCFLVQNLTLEKIKDS